ncbi:AAA family ATPase [Sphingosinicella ginsenosidimutans]
MGLVFADFTWKAGVAGFRRFNLIYGWNGCGKTTLTRLFDELSAATLPDLSYEIEDSNGAKFGPGDAFPTPIRVFNQDYIQKNVRVLESSANSISLLLGEENKELVAQIQQDEQELNGDPSNPEAIGKLRELEGYRQKKRRKEKENDTAFTDIARTIGAALASTGAASRTYRSPQAKTDFAALKEATILPEEEMAAHVLALKQDLLPEIPEVLVPAMGETEQVDALQTAQGCATLAETLCATTVETEVVSQLAANPEISEWVETGFHLHNRLGSGACEFCGNAIPVERLAQLARHFNDADRKLKADIEDVLVRLRSALIAVRACAVPDAARLYGELQNTYSAKARDFETAKAALETQITVLGQALQAKKSQTTVSTPLQVRLDTDTLANAISAANALISTHNVKSREFAKLQGQSISAIKAHYLSTIFSEVQERNQAIAALEEDLKRREEEITALRKRIAAARQKVSSAHAACGHINDGLRTFLGRDELRFEPLVEEVEGEDGTPTEVVVGYKIMRGGIPARYVSEGEKTALAFVYFVVHLNDGQFPKQTGIVVIDDPISSLDSTSLYQAFSFLKNAVLDCGQVFVLTHNFDFLKLLLNWRKSADRGGTGFYMIKNHVRDGARHATIEVMDKELLEYESEYHYLFKRLKEMRAAQDGSIMQAYPVPNIARKVWDTFLMFQVPSGAKPYKKMEELKAAGHDARKLDAIYKFTNDQSHITGAGFDPALVPETQKVLGELFEMMEAIAPGHYAILDGATPL